MKHVFPLQNPLDKISHAGLPSTAGIYLFKKEKPISTSVNPLILKPVYFLMLRTLNKTRKEFAIVSQSDSIETQITDSEFKALLLESELIQIHHPKYNVIWRDGKKSSLYKNYGGKVPENIPGEKRRR